MSLTNECDKQRAQLAAVNAYEAELTDGPDQALRILGPPTDPIRMRATLGILLRAGRHKEAADLIRDKPPAAEWIDYAALVFARVRDHERAYKMIDRADECPTPGVMRRTRLAFAEGVTEDWQERYGAGSLLGSTDWSESDVTLAGTVIAILDPLLASVRANRCIKGDLELAAVMHAVCCARIQKESQQVEKYAGWLEKHVPVPLLFGELCLREIVDCADNLPNRLRVEHAGEFQTALLAALLERDRLDRSGEAFDALVALASQAQADDDKKALATALFETCGLVPPQRVDQAIATIRGLLPEDARYPALLEVFRQMSANELADARTRLDALRDEPDAVWWQAHAQLCEREGNDGDAAAAWQQAGELLPHPGILQRSARASLDRRRFESAILALKRLLANDPDNEEYLSPLVTALFELNDFAQAEEYLVRLVDIRPAETQYRFALAQCFARTARPAKGIDVLQPVCDSDEPPVDVLLLQSELLDRTGRPGDALRLLQSIAADHWDEPQFLLRYMACAHRAGQERVAHHAFVRLVELRRQGKVPAELMQAGTLEQLLEYGKEYRNQRESLQQEVIAGRLPWLFVEDALRNAATWAWMLHTQDVKWISEEPLARASLTIYATNGFTVRQSDSSTRLELISVLAQGQEVVADLSSLITLHQLGELERTADFFGTLVLPASYGKLRVADADRFGLHQPSRKKELQRIRDEIDRKRVHIAAGHGGDLIPVDEYCNDADRHVYRLQDLLAPLRAAQKAPSRAIEETARLAHQPSRVDHDNPAIALGASIMVDLITLRTLASEPTFESIVENFSVHIVGTQYEELVNELRAYEAANDAQRAHDVLWSDISALVDHGKARWEPFPSECQGNEDDDAEVPRSVHLDALKLAHHLGRPLLADDRVLQVCMFQDASDGPSRAFSSSHVLLAMLERGVCSAALVAAHVLRLMRWRYRFVVPTPALLVCWAEEAIANPPGDALIDVAVYLHDCLRDPGIHCGMEASTPPMPMAGKLVTAWLDAIATFLANIWEDNRFSEEFATGLTNWVGEELLPSCPRGLWFQQVGQNLAKVSPNAILKMCMVQMVGVSSRHRASLGLRTLANALGVTDDTFLTITSEAIDAISGY